MHDRKSPDISLPRFVSGLAELSAGYDVLLCDVWGVIHDGLNPHLAAIDALQQFRAKGGKVILVSNAPIPAGAVRYRLDRLPVPRKAYDAIVTSGDIIASLIVERGDAPLFNLGPSYDRSLYREVRKISGRAPRLAKLKDAAYVVCTGLFDPDTETPADYDPVLTLMRDCQLDFLCANPDIVVHVGPKLLYCAGAIAQRYEQTGGTVIQGGKPHPLIYQRALGLAEKCLGRVVERARVLVIGDAMQTDIKGAREQSLASLFILEGIHRSEILASDSVRSDHNGRASAKTLIEPLTEFFRAAGFAPSAALLQLKW